MSSGGRLTLRSPQPWRSRSCLGDARSARRGISESSGRRQRTRGSSGAPTTRVGAAHRPLSPRRGRSRPLRRPANAVPGRSYSWMGDDARGGSASTPAARKRQSHEVPYLREGDHHKSLPLSRPSRREGAGRLPPVGEGLWKH